MADNLIFPIGFDLEAGIKAAEKNADMALRRLQTALNRKPLSVPITMDASKFAMFERQFSNSINGIQAKLAQAQRLWNSMTFDVKFDENGNLSRRAQIVFDAFNQLTQASATMGQRLGEVNRQLAQSEAETARLITAEYDKRKRQIDEQIRIKERQAAAEERVRQSQLKGVNVGYVDLQKQTEAVRNLRLQYEAILPMLNALAQKRVDIKVSIDKQFEADINRINAEIARLRQSNLQLGAKGDVNAIQANLAAIRQLEAELQRISQQKIDLLNTNKINSDISRLRTEIASVFGDLQSAERKLAADNSLNAALDAQSQKVLNLHAQIQKLDQQVAQLNAQGKMYNADGSFSSQATTLLQQRIALTKQLEQAAVTGQQAQIKLEQQLREEKRRTDQEAKQAAKEAERQAKAEAAARKQAIEAANAENKARQAAYNARRKQGLETQRILQKEAKSIADITAQLQIQQQRLNNANVGSAKFNKIAEEVKRLTAELDKANQRMRELTGQATSGAAKQASAVRQVSNEYKHQDGYISRLIKRLAVYAGYQQISNFLTKVREVTAQFELQRISLGAIIQDQTRANALFSEIKQFALKSPISIMDLTKYTKQVAAYRIGTDKLFDTTKRLADVSVGLGVDMGRIVLAYGQVKAASYLRAAEIRQFTEAGIPMLELLAEKFTELNGEAVTTEQVMGMVSKRMVGFEMVEEIFNDMTSAGGMFYNMQEKQGNTLYGMWAKLGDAASMMYDEIGNTDSVNSGMKRLIQLLTDLMKNWQSVGRGVVVAGVAFAVIKAQMKMAAVSATESQVKTAQYRMELQRLQAQYLSTSGAAKVMTLGQIGYVRVQGMATTATIAFGNALRTMKAVLVSTGWGALAVAIGYVIEKLFFAKSAADKLKESLEKVYEETTVEQGKSTRNFEYLAKLATDATKGYKERQTALEELQRTYKDILPSEVMEIEYLTKLKGNYDSLTNSIRTYVAEQQRRKAIDEISSTYGGEKLKYERKLTDFFREDGWSEQEIARFWEQFYKIAADKSKSLEQVVFEAAKKGGRDGFATVQKLLQNQDSLTKDLDKSSYKNLGISVFGSVDYIDMLRDAVLEENQALEQNEERTKAAAAAASQFAEAYAKSAERIANATLTKGSGEEVDPDSYLGGQMLKNAEVKGLSDILKDEFEKAGVEWDNGFGNFINKINASKPELISSLDFTAILDSLTEKLNDPKLTDAQREMITNLISFAREAQQKYWEIIPKDPVVRTWQQRFRQIAQAVGGFRREYNQYLMKAGEDLEAYNKRLKGSLEGLKNNVKGLLATQKLVVKAGIFAKLLYGVSADELQAKIDEANNEIKVIEKVLAEQPNFEKSKSKSSGSKSDPRLQILNEMVQLAEKLNKEYSDWEKKAGSTKALEKVNATYKETVRYAEKVAKDAGIKLPHLETPANAKELNDYLESVRKVMETAKGLKGGKKAAIELAVKMSGNVSAEEQKAIEEKIKALADKISRTKTAKEFYEKILRLTRNENLAFQATFSVYGKDTLDTFTDEVEQLKENFGEIDITAAINLNTRQIDYKKLREIWDADKALPLNLRKIPEEYDSAIKSILDAGDKMSQKQLERWGKDLERAREYADKRIELAQYTATQIAEIEAKRDSLDPESKNYAAQAAMYNKMISGYREREKNEAAKLDYEQVKEQIGMFDDLGVRIGTAFENILNQLRAYTQSPDFARLGLEAQKNVYQQIAKIEDRMAEGFQGIGIGTVSEYIREYSMAASEYLTAQNNLRDATLRAIEADKEWERVKDSNNEAAKTAALAEKQLADSRVRTAAASVNTAGANLQRTQNNAARASQKFDNNLQKVENSLKSLNNGALSALWNLLGVKGKRSVGEFLSGSYKMVNAIDKLKEALADSGSDMGELSKTIGKNLATALSNINPDDTEAITKAATDSLKATLSSVISDPGVVELLADTLSKNIGEIASQALSGVLSTEDAVNKVAGLIDGVADAASKTGELWGAIISLVLSLLDEFAENGIGTFLGELLDSIADAVEGILANLLTDSIPKILVSVGNVVKGVLTGLGDLLTFGAFDLTGAKRVKRADKEIKHQKELLEQLEYTYGRLEKAADKAFGRDYINNYNQQIKNLEAQAAAYQAQADAERSKGKKEDKEKTKEFENAYRDTMDEIADMQGQIAARMLGTDLTSAARDFAQAWLDAYKEFGNTADAMSEKFREMIENMVVESMLAKVMERALKPMFDMIDDMGDQDFYSESFWKNVVATAEQGARDADYGAQTAMKFLEQAGVSMRNLGGEMTGMSRDIASASEESINGLAAGINTQNYYIAQIHANVASIAAAYGLGDNARESFRVDYTPLVQQSLDNQAMLIRNTAEAVVECRRSAVAAESTLAEIRRVIIPRTSSSPYVVAVRL